MARLLQCPDCGSVVNATAQRLHQDWHDTHDGHAAEVEVENWPVSNIPGEDFRTPGI